MSPQELQLKYELDCDAEAAANRLQALHEAANNGDSEAPRAQRLAGQMFGEVRDILAAMIDVKTRGTGGKYKNWLRKLGADKAAAIAIRECIVRCTAAPRDKSKTYPTAQRLTHGVGKLYELEVRIMEAEEVNPVYMERIHEQIKENQTKNLDHIRRLYNVAYDRVMKGELDSELTDSEAAQVGKFGVDACYQVGLITKIDAGTGMAHYTVDPDMAEYLMGYDETDVYSVVDRSSGAMLCEPQPWTTLTDGGYLSVRRKAQFPLMDVVKMRRSERARIRALFTEANMPKVFECANFLQSRKFTIHRPTLDAITRLWRSGGGTMGVPSREQPRKPQFPLPADWVKADGNPEELRAFKTWKRAASKYYTGLKTWRGHTQEIGGFIKMGHRMTDAIWFPVFMDTRGRWYYHGTPNPQGSDISKSVLHFYDKKPLGKRGLFWLKVAIANNLGYDKKRMAQRAAYTESIWPRLEAALDAPEDNPEVFGKDAPWGVFAAAWELREALRCRHPETYETGIIVHMDATCSGLQHFSAMLRDEVGGRYVNLFDIPEADEKQDIYTKVADEGVKSMMAESVTYAVNFWAEEGISRNRAKGPVMTYVYGATLLGAKDDLADDLDETRDDEDMEEGQTNNDVAQVAAKALFAGIEVTVPAAANGMRWLQQSIKTAPKNRRMEWTTPTGFRVQHDYQASVEVRVKINSCGVQRIVFREFTDDVNKHGMRNAISPNFVHGLDASHLTLTALGMKAKGKDFVGIHDSFGTHPCDVDELQYETRYQFVKMYTEHDVLRDFLWEVGGLGSVPPKGNLDLSKVMDSEFFFS